MDSITISGSLPGVKNNFKEIIKEELLEIMELSARKFVRAASSRIPKLSGMAGGALLSRKLRTNLLPGSQRPAPRSTRFPAGQTPAAGAAMSYANVTWNTFEWWTYVPHFVRHDAEEWDAVDTGAIAFENEFEFLISDANSTWFSVGLPNSIIGDYDINV